LGGEFVEIFIHILELTYPVGKGVLYLASTQVETEAEQKLSDRKGPPKSNCTWFGYRRGQKRYAHRFVAITTGVAVCVPLTVLLVWSILRLASRAWPVGRSSTIGVG
jgi:hypothetical protein